VRALVLCGIAALVAGAGIAAAALVAGGAAGSTATAAAPTGDALVRAAQRQLGVSADGVLGPATRAALREFQQVRGLPVTGQLDEATLVALDLVAQRLTVLSTTVASGAVSQAMAERASAPASAPEESVAPADPAATTPAQSTTTPTTTTTTTPTPPAEDDDEGPAAPVTGGALAGSPPPVVGGQVPDDAGLSPVPPRPDRRPPAKAPAEIPAPGGLSPRPPVSDEVPVSPELRARLERIARCESNGDPRAVSPGGRYRGKYQFSRATWRAVGGKGDPAAASEAEQDRRAAILYRRQGAAPWPVCGRR
jgi:peptidoglycan hydrolase-like protein with peptidoglycan-binding domain